MAVAAKKAGRASQGAANKQAQQKSVAKKITPNVPQFDRIQDLAAYREMLLIRRFEEKAGQMYGMGLIGGFCHLYIGQEAVVVGMQMTTREGDQVITGCRDHGHMLACGMDPKGVMNSRVAGAGCRKARAAPCTCSQRRSTSTAATASSAPKCRLGPASPSPTGTGTTATSASRISATALRTRARSTRASTWRRFGSSPWST